MNFYIDFEATQPEQEIISVGVTAETGETFYRLVRPQFSKVSSYVTKLTGISQSSLTEMPELDDAFCELYSWMMSQEKEIINWNIYSYGDGDISFVKYSLKNLVSNKAILLAYTIMERLEDYSKTVFKYFKGSTSLINAYNYILHMEDKQKHNALEDALMLQTVFNHVNNSKVPLEDSPFEKKNDNNTPYVFPSGNFYCCLEGKRNTEKCLGSIDDTIDWILHKFFKPEDRVIVHRDRIAKKIMKAIRKNNRYMNYTWRRVK